VPKLIGVRERRHQYYYDTLVRATGGATATPTVQESNSLFNGTNLGLREWTNMQIAGMFASDETFVVLAMRVWCFFRYSIVLDVAIYYQQLATQLYLTLETGDKPQFQGPMWTFPAAGGLDGRESMGNGEPTAAALFKFAKPIPIPARQHFHVTCQLFDTGATSVRSYLNSGQGTGMREVKVFLDGLHTRDVL
jgi:hypothetical protein